MNDEPTQRVWVAKRRTRKGTSYHPRWVCPTERRKMSRKIGTDRRVAEREAALLEQQLGEGTYRHIKQIGWAEFVEDHVAKLQGKHNAVEARHVLTEFGRIVRPVSPKHVTYSMIERYAAHLREQGNKPATIAKKLRYIRSGLNAAVKRHYAAVSEFDGRLFPAVEKRPPRIVSEDEEARLLDVAGELYGFPMRAFVFIAVNTGGRRAELTGLPWERVTLDGDEPEIHFAGTKSHRDRLIPLTPELVDVLLRLKAMTLVQGGPFIGLAGKLDRRWGRIRKQAGTPDVTVHDLRRTYVARLIRVGVPLPTVQELAGHRNIATTVEYYNWVSKSDRRAAMEKLRSVASG